MSEKPFQFKQFTVEQDRAAMKVGTDGVLLGAWTALNHPGSILDIGAGTGLIALMLAQRSDAEQIDALEIDGYAYEQCVENFENSPWSDRLFCYHASLDAFTAEMQEEEPYDLIVSNPPFFAPAEAFSESGDTPENDKRKTARFYDSLPFEELLASASALLADDGNLAVIIPFTEETQFLTLADNHGLFPNRITRVRGTEKSPVKRSLLQLSFSQVVPDTTELILEESRHYYTEAYKALVKDFYLKL